MLKVIATAFIGCVVIALVMPDIISIVVLSAIWGTASGVFWAEQDNKNQECQP